MDWKNPEYGEIIQQRMRFLEYLREDKERLEEAKRYYRHAPDGPADFISDWGMTFDPRNAERGLPTRVPFILFPKQREWILWVIRHWLSQTPGLCEKSRDMGISWLSTSLASTLCLFHDGLAIGFGSRLTDYVDKIGTMKPLLPKARMFMEAIPEEFLGGWQSWRDASFMRINFPGTGSIIMGEGGDQIGRGDRASIYFIDEAAYLERPELVEASLSQTTNCRIDMSSVNGMNNPFATKRHAGKIDVFVFDWRDDPRKDQAWYDLLDKGEDEGGKGLDPVTIAQEVDRNYSASVSGIVIPNAWVQAAVDAYEKLGIKPGGLKRLALDVADEGVDKNALVGATGNEIDYLDEFSGKGSDIFATTARAFEVCDAEGYPGFRYDADGLGAGVRGDARIINQARQGTAARQYTVIGFRGSQEVVDPVGIVEGTIGLEGDRGRMNKDYFANRKAQGWWTIRNMFRKTFRWVVEGHACDPDDVISISSKATGSKRMFAKLVTELSQPTYTTNLKGKIVINKKPDGMKSPNLGDGAMELFAKMEPPAMNITPNLITELRMAGLTAGRRRIR